MWRTVSVNSARLSWFALTVFNFDITVPVTQAVQTIRYKFLDRRVLGSIQEEVIQNSWLIKWKWNRVFSKYIRSPPASKLKGITSRNMTFTPK
jgi:hypothetical protein